MAIDKVDNVHFICFFQRSKEIITARNSNKAKIKTIKMKGIISFVTLSIMSISSFIAFDTCDGFFQESFSKMTSSSNKPKIPTVADNAIQIFNKTYPFNRPPVQSSAFVRFGMPVADFDGTILQKQKNGGGNTGKRLTDITPKQARETFNEIAKLYGNDNAFDMVKSLPIILSFNKKEFNPSLKAMSIALKNEDIAKKVVQLNPGLLAVKESDAATVSEQTIVFSYIVGYTRPLGPVLLPALLLALFSPVIEATTGIPIQSSFLALFSSIQ